MKYRSLVRALATSAALAAAGVLMAGCNSDEISLATNAKANQPVPPKLIQAMVEKDMDLNSPMLVRLFKQEAELEVWKQDRSGRFALLKTYPICRWSGDLGPKVREGDRQAPEGFYNISPAQMNPQSAYYLSFNTGYPNAFDKALGRTGSQLMVHGDCSSRGCYAMTDEQIAEIYSLGRESFFGGQNSFQLQAYPFRMTPINMAQASQQPEHAVLEDDQGRLRSFRGDEAGAEGRFLREEVRVRCHQARRMPRRDPVFDASAKCPAYAIPDEIADAVREKQSRTTRRPPKLIARGTPVARINTGIDGGMNKVFAARVPEGNTGLSEGGDSQGLATLALSRAPGTIPSTVNPPRAPATPSDSLLQGAPEEPRLAVAPAPTAGPTRVANAAPTAQNDGFFSSLARKVGIGGSADATATVSTTPPAPPKPKVIEAKRTDAPPRPEVAMPKPAAAPKAVATAKPALKPSVSDAPAQPPHPRPPRPARWQAQRRSCRRTRSTAASAPSNKPNGALLSAEK